MNLGLMVLEQTHRFLKETLELECGSLIGCFGKVMQTKKEQPMKRAKKEQPFLDQ